MESESFGIEREKPVLVSKSSCKVQRGAVRLESGVRKFRSVRIGPVGKISPPDKLILSVLKSKDQKFREFSITTMMICAGNLLASLLLMGTQRLNGQSLETVRRRHDRVASH